MKYREVGNIKHLAKQNFLATTQLAGVLREVNYNGSWKNKSSKLIKTKTIHIKRDKKCSNIMTEEYLDHLFHKSKEKQNRIKIKTEANVTKNHREQYKWNKKEFNDYTLSVKFLNVQDQNDKLLTGLPKKILQQPDQRKIQELFHDQKTDLTTKFKKDYIVGKIIGEGAYASVRVALYRPENLKIAIKAYEKAKIKEPQRKKSVRREIKILQMLDHPNIVKIYDVVQTNNHLNIVMEYLPGISLSTCLKNQPNQRFSEQNCKTIIKALANALKYLHDQQISHRDIKLENIILNDDLDPKLIDFGFSTCIQQHKKIKIFCGTPSYMAPEIVQKKEYRGESADIWALGVLFYVLMTGSFPYKGLTDQDLYKKINGAEYPRQEISVFKDAHQLIGKMFTINPDQRITATQILAHPWFGVQKPYNEIKIKKTKISFEAKYINTSIGRSIEKNQPSKIKKKKMAQGQNEKILLKTAKQLSSKLNYVYGRANFAKTLTNPQRDSGNNTAISIKSNKKQNLKILDFLQIEIKKRKQDKSKCKSHRA